MIANQRNRLSLPELQSTAVFVYAVGGGRGHGVRGLLLAYHFQSFGLKAHLVTRRGALQGVDGLPNFESITEISEPIDLATVGDLSEPGHTTLIVDTFEGGWWNEISEDILSTFQECVFVARYRHDLDLTTLSPRYTQLWLPYSDRNNEWGEVPPNGVLIGEITKPFRITATPISQRLVLFDPETRCSDRFITEVTRLASDSAFTLHYTHELSEARYGEKILIIGAGYNTFYEFQDYPGDVRFLPVRKLHDDQLRRAAMAGRGVLSMAEIAHWVGGIS